MVDKAQEPSVLSSGISIPVDPEPTSFRLTLLLILVLGFIAGYVVSSVLFAVGACNLLSVFVGLGTGAGSMQLAENYLRPRWNSNKSVELTPTSIDIVHSGQRLGGLDPTQHINVYAWRFEVPRRTRVPKGWYVVGLALEQDEVFFPVYTLISPDDFTQLTMNGSFTPLRKQKRREDNMRLAGQHRRLLQAEAARNMDGLEMDKHHFETYLQFLQQNYPEWMPRS